MSGEFKVRTKTCSEETKEDMKMTHVHLGEDATREPKPSWVQSPSFLSPSKNHQCMFRCARAARAGGRSLGDAAAAYASAGTTNQRMRRRSGGEAEATQKLRRCLLFLSIFSETLSWRLTTDLALKFWIQQSFWSNVEMFGYMFESVENSQSSSSSWKSLLRT